MLAALLVLLAWPAAAAELSAPAPVPELIRPPAVSLFDRAPAVCESALSYGAALESANPVTAATLARNPAIAAIHLDASSAERGRISAVVKAAQGAAVFGHFQSADDPSLKPKLDEGLLGAVLERAPDLKQTLKFLRRLYVPPMGQRSVGPSDVTGYLSDVPGFVGKSNGVFIGGVSIGDARGARNIDSIVKAKARGLRLIHVDPSGLTPAETLRVEAAARRAGIPLSGKAASREEARAMHARGYRHVVLGSDADAVKAGFSRFADAPRDAAREPGPRPASGNPIEAWLKAGKIGTLGFLMSPDVPLALRLASGAGALWMDGEDGQFTTRDIGRIVAALPPGTPVAVRASQFDDPDIGSYLAAGAHAVVAPQVSTAWQARRFVETVKKADPSAVAIVMIETKRGLANVSEIARVPGVGVLFIGPHDLSLSMGLSKSDPKFKAAVARVEAAARAAGVPLGGLAASRSQAYAMQERGYGFVTTVSDQFTVGEHFKKLLTP